MEVDIMRSQMARAALLVDPMAQTAHASLLSDGEISMVVVEPETRREHAHLLRQAFALRHRSFVERRGWHELRHPDGIDRDAHDAGAALHVLDLNESRVFGHLRLIPGGYLHAAKADPELFAPPQRPEDVFGLSRLCYEPGLPAEQCWMGIARLFGAAAAVARRARARQFIFDTDPVLVLYLRALGLQPRVIGEAVMHHGNLMQPIALMV